MSFSAQIVADSKNEFGNRLTTFLITVPRIILAEINTHRMLSKNSASSRAIPFKKMVEAVETNPFIPIKWMKEHRGMQGTEYFDETALYNTPENNKDAWLRARDWSISFAKSLNQEGNGVSKQICNRLLEPFMWHTILISGTEWENFFALRANPGAEIHFQKIAYMMLEEYNKSTPKLLKAGELHIPYEDKIDDIDQLHEVFSPSNPDDLNIMNEEWKMLKVKISTVMAARTSYTVVGADQKPLTYQRMIEIHDEMREADPKHMSPFEHCAQANFIDEWSGNFRGFIQYRKMIENENARDQRVIKK